MAAALLTEKEIPRGFGNPFAAFSGRNRDDEGNGIGPEAGAGAKMRFETGGIWGKKNRNRYRDDRKRAGPPRFGGINRIICGSIVKMM